MSRVCACRRLDCQREPLDERQLFAAHGVVYQPPPERSAVDVPLRSVSSILEELSRQEQRVRVAGRSGAR